MSTKKVHTQWQRHYRNMYTPRKNEQTFQIVLEESDIMVTAEKNLASPMLKTLHNLRADIKAWLHLYPEFRTSLVPLPMPEGAIPSVIKRMYAGSAKAHVGPFAAVAGTIAHMLAEEYAPISPNIIVENGGDVYMFSHTERRVALLANPVQTPQNSHAMPSLGLLLKAQDFPLALCASSATIGHSLSLGQGELAAVLAKDGAFADAMATALGNGLKNPQNIETVLNTAKQYSEIHGVFLQCGEAIGIWGDLELIQTT